MANDDDDSDTMLVIVTASCVCVQKTDMEEYSKKYNDAANTLEDALTKVFDHVSLWGDDWKKFSDDEKSAFCPPPSSAETETVPVEPSPAAGAQSQPPADRRETAESSSADETAAAAAVTPRSAASINHGRKTSTTASERNDVDDNDARKGKKWNCYTVFISEALAAAQLSKVSYGIDVRKRKHRFLLLFFSVFPIFSCCFRAVDLADSCQLLSAR